MIGVIALIPGPAGPPTLIGWDKLDHAAAFAAFTVLARSGWPNTHRLVTAACGFAYGAALEFAQATLAIGRVASVSDAAANAVGISVGLTLAWGLARLARAVPVLDRRR